MSTEISVHRAGGLALATFADAMKFGETVANSEFAPKDFRGKPASCMLAIQAGAEIGLAPLQALQSIAVVNGRPAVFGDAALAVAKASPVCEYVTESVDGDGEQMVATCTAKRRGYPQPTVVRFNVTDAKKAGLWGKAGPWTQYPKRMLQMRARGFALRDAFPDVLKGLVTAEEAQDYPQPVEQPPAVTVTQERPSVPPQETPVGKAKVAISKCQDLAAAERLRELITQRETAGVFTREEAAQLLQLLHGRVEMLIGSEGQDVTNAVEVTA